MLPHIQETIDAIEILRQELKEFRQQCGHTDISYEYKSNTGNWCEMDDSYWVDVICNNCGDTMSFDSEKHPVDYRLKGVIGSVKQHNLGRY